MTLKTGHTYNYHWLETSSDNKTIGAFLSDYSKFILNKNLAIISFDSDSFVPTDDEIKRGWTFKNEIAYFEKINIDELNGPIFDIYDQWFIFDKPTEINDVDIFVNYSGFSVDLNSNDKDFLIPGATNKFWKTIKRIKPSHFILCGDNFIFGSLVDTEIKEIEKAWC